MNINWLFFGFYFVTTAVIHVLHVFLLDPLIGTSTFFFATYTLCQCALETGILILCATWIKHFLPKWISLYALAVFFLFLSHLIDFFLVRFFGMSFWFSLHFAFQETYANFIELLIASNISLLSWLALALGGCGLIFSGLFLHRLTEKWKKPIRLSRFFLIFGLTALCFLCIDYRINNTDSFLCLDRLKQVLPWKRSLFAPEQATLLLDAPLQSHHCEEELLSQLDSRAFSLRHQPDIYLFITESLRNDFITKEITPNLYNFKKENTSFTTTFSNANGTFLSWYSLFHSRFAFDWKKESLETEKKGSLPLRLLKKMGYKIHVSTSARLHFYQMNTILFGEKEYLADSLFSPEDNCREIYLRDETVINHLISKMQEPESGRLFIIFLDSTHLDYSWPKKISPFAPYQDNISYVNALLSRKCPQPLINRYKNSLYFVDALFGKFSRALKTAPGGDDAVIIFTGDHGEEFYEQGNLFHGSSLSYQQITPPLYYRFGQNSAVKNKPHCDTTCHMDIFPTLFHYLLGEDLMQQVLVGQSIFKKDRWPFTLIARFNASRVPFEYCLHSDKNKLVFEFSNDIDPFASKELNILSTKSLHDDTLLLDTSALQEEFGPALKRLFPTPVK